MNTKLPDCVGVPESVPLGRDSSMPSGRPAADQVNGGTKKVLLAVKVIVG